MYPCVSEYPHSTHLVQLGDLQYYLNSKKGGKKAWTEAQARRLDGESLLPQPRCQFLPGPSPGWVRWKAAGDPFGKILFTPLSLVPLDGGARKKDHQEAWQQDASLLVLELFLREPGHRALLRTLALSYFLLRGILCPKGTSSISFCNKRAW